MHDFPSQFRGLPRSLSDRGDPAEVFSAVSNISGAEFRRHFFRRSSSQPSFYSGFDEEIPYRRTAKTARLEAALFVAEGALSTQKLTQLATLVDVAETRLLIDRLNAAYDETGSSFRIERVATGYRLLTRPEFSPWLDKLHQRHSELKLSPPAMETLTLVAYLQPITRADVESIRGVQCAEMLKQLIERDLVRITGEDESLGRPYLYGTTRIFLELFGLRHLDDLPMADQLRRIQRPVRKPECSRDSSEGEPGDSPEKQESSHDSDSSEESDQTGQAA